jgi:hypothetical protein
MIKNTLALILVISITYLPSLSFAEEPYIGLGMVNHTLKDDDGDENDYKTQPTSYRFTVGSRIAKNYIIEAYFLSNESSDNASLGTIITTFDFEYEQVFGASINYALVAGPLTIYGGPNITAAKLTATVDRANSSSTISDTDEIILNSQFSETLLSGGIGVGVDLRVYKNISIDLNAQSYLFDGDRLGTGVGAELRYHL